MDATTSDEIDIANVEREEEVINILSDEIKDPEIAETIVIGADSSYNICALTPGCNGAMYILPSDSSAPTWKCAKCRKCAVPRTQKVRIVQQSQLQPIISQQRDYYEQDSYPFIGTAAEHRSINIAEISNDYKGAPASSKRVKFHGENLAFFPVSKESSIEQKPRTSRSREFRPSDSGASVSMKLPFRSHICQVCNAYFSSLNSLRDHKQSEIHLLRLQENDRQRTFESCDEIDLALAGNLVPKSFRKSKDQTRFLYSLGDPVLSSSASVKRLERSSAVGIPQANLLLESFFCEYCNRRYATRAEFTRHKSMGPHKEAVALHEQRERNEEFRLSALRASRSKELLQLPEEMGIVSPHPYPRERTFSTSDLESSAYGIRPPQGEPIFLEAIEDEMPPLSPPPPLLREGGRLGPTIEEASFPHPVGEEVEYSSQDEPVRIERPFPPPPRLELPRGLRKPRKQMSDHAQLVVGFRSDPMRAPKMKLDFGAFNPYLRCKCEFCGLLHNSWSDMRRHYRENHRREFPSQSALNRHVVEKFRDGAGGAPSGVVLFLCPKCKLEHGTMEDLMLHASRVHDGRIQVFECKRCPERFESEEEFQFHVKDVHTERSTCNMCGRSFMTRRNMERHQKESCRGQEYTDSVAGELAPHMHHKPVVLTAEMESEHQFGCEFCPDLHKTTEELQRHYVHAHRGQFDSLTQLMNHVGEITSYFRDQRSSTTELLLWQCPECPDVYYDNKELLRIHSEQIIFFQAHGKGVIYECRYCPEAFLEQDLLTDHIKEVHKKTENCEFCGQWFTQEWNLKRHMKEICRSNPAVEALRKQQQQRISVEEERTSNRPKRLASKRRFVLDSADY